MNQEDAILRLRRKEKVLVNTLDRVIHLPQAGPGIRMWSLIDYLVNKHGFRWTRL